MTDLVDIAEAEVGYVEQGGPDGRSGNITMFGKAYGLDGYAWCSMFVWWCFHQLGIDVRHDVSGNYAGAEQAMEGFAAKGWEIHQHPQRNDVVFFHFPGEADGADHTGIVVTSDSGGVHTIEGNTSSGDAGSQSNGGGVYRRYRPFSTVIGYGRYPLPIPQEEDIMASLDEVRQVVREEVAVAVKQLHAEHVLLLHGDAKHGNSIDSIARAVKVPGA